MPSDERSSREADDTALSYTALASRARVPSLRHCRVDLPHVRRQAKYRASSSTVLSVTSIECALPMGLGVLSMLPAILGDPPPRRVPIAL